MKTRLLKFFIFNHLDTLINRPFLRCRGPDCSSQCRITRDTTGLLFSGHVLHLRGDKLVPQPARHDSGDLLLWNGEIFGGIQVCEGDNDTRVLLDLLASSNSDDHILTTLSKIQGPWAFMYWQASSETLWFGRDVFGRRSLLWHLPDNENDIFCLSSVQIRPFLFQELPSVGIYKLSFTHPTAAASNDLDPVYKITLFPWQHAVWPGTMETVTQRDGWMGRMYAGECSNTVTLEMSPREVPSQMPPLNKDIPSGDSTRPQCSGQQPHTDYLLELLKSDPFMRKLSRQLTDVLLKAVQTRVDNQSSCPLLLDKGHEGTLPATSCATSDDSNSETNMSCTVDDSRCKAHGALYKESTEVDKDTLGADMNRCVSGTDELMDGSSDDVSGKILRSSARVAILFSGGIDSTVIAALADRCVPKEEPIDLLNVAFEMKGKGQAGNKKMSTHDTARLSQWDVPDRLAGYTALSELNPHRAWNFVEVNVTAAELQEMRSQRIRHLLYPLQTVLDDSIGCAIWFAARGRGILGNGPQKGELIQSTSRVILCGMGADEQLIGYSRHRGRFQEEGWPGLVNEIELEITRISARNLGRDDRIITDHGKESRFPFLDEQVVQFLSSLPVHQKADLTLPRGLGEKLLLRLAAMELGLPQTATLPKRAIQFGSRIAKLENTKERASDVCTRLADLEIS